MRLIISVLSVLVLIAVVARLAKNWRQKGTLSNFGEVTMLVATVFSVIVIVVLAASWENARKDRDDRQRAAMEEAVHKQAQREEAQSVNSRRSGSSERSDTRVDANSQEREQAPNTANPVEPQIPDQVLQLCAKSAQISFMQSHNKGVAVKLMTNTIFTSLGIAKLECQ